MRKYLKGNKTNSDYIRGFTLFEVLAATMVLSVALIPIFSWLPTAIQTRVSTEHKTTAIFLAQGEIEELRRRIKNNFSFNYSLNSASFASPYQDFRYNVSDNSNSNLKTISVTVWHIDRPQDATIFYTQVSRR